MQDDKKIAAITLVVLHILNWDCRNIEGLSAKKYTAKAIYHDLVDRQLRIPLSKSIAMAIDECQQGRRLTHHPDEVLIMDRRTRRYFAIQRKWQAELCN